MMGPFKRESFGKAIEYRKYRLKNTLQRYSLKIVLRIAKLVKKIRSQLNEPDFD